MPCYPEFCFAVVVEGVAGKSLVPVVYRRFLYGSGMSFVGVVSALFTEYYGAVAENVGGAAENGEFGNGIVSHCVGGEYGGGVGQHDIVVYEKLLDIGVV